MSYSVIIPSHKRPQMLTRALHSVYAQTVLPDTIYLVIDEPENWGAYGFLKGFDDRIQVTFTGGGYGGAKARNVGLGQVVEEYVFFLDDDDEWAPDKVELQLEELMSDVCCVAVTCSCLNLYEQKQTVTSRDEAEVNRYIRVLNLVGGFSCFGFRRIGALKDIRLRDSLKSAQDYEFYIRVSQYGKFAVVDKPLVNFYQHMEERITTSAGSHRRHTLYEVLEQNQDLMETGEEYFFKAKIEILTAADCEHLIAGVGQYCKGCWFLLLAHIYPSLSLKIMFRGSKALVSNLIQRLK